MQEEQQGEAAKDDDEYRPTVRLCEVKRSASASCGFHLSRTQWDPYPWVSGVEAGSAAEAAGLLSGDCVLEVNGEDVLGLKICDVAEKVKARADRVSLLLWNSGSDPQASAGISWAASSPLSLQRLSTCLQSAIQLLECPVCLETASPPAFQCCNGHLLCGACRARSDKCPVCRAPLGARGRCLLADKLHALFAATFSARRPPAPQPPSEPAEAPQLAHCPYPACRRRLPPPAMLRHLREGHDGPLVQFSPRGAARVQLPTPLDPRQLVAVSACGGLDFFVASEGRRLWLWLLGDRELAAGFRVQATSSRGSTAQGAVYSLAVAREDVVAGGDCAELEDVASPGRVQLQLVKVGAQAS
ncbi:E3 ubiquitin-protein ligase sina-like isoform X2 [Bacillus rossius redtenbacheri]